MTDLAATVSALEKRLGALEDREQLYQLLSAFGPHMDGGSPDSIANFFTDDGEWHMGNIPGVPPLFKGREAMMSLLAGPQHQGLVARGVAHTMGFPHITIDGDAAQLICHSIRLERNDLGWKPARVSANVFSCSRVDGRWLMTRRVNRELGTQEARDLFATSPYDLPWS